MKYRLKNEYKELLNEVRVSIETPDDFYDYEFPDDTDFKTLRFYNDNTQLKDANLVRIIPKNVVSSTDFNRSQNIYGIRSFINKYLNDNEIQRIYVYYNNDSVDKSITIDIKDLDSYSSDGQGQLDKVNKAFKNKIYKFFGGSLSYFIIQVLKNVLISDRKVYGKLFSYYKSKENNALLIKILKDCIKDKLNNNIILNTLKEISIFKEPKKGSIVKANINFFDIFNAILSSDDIEHIINNSNKIKMYLEENFKNRSRELGDTLTTPEIWPVIAKEYITNSNEALSILLREIDKHNSSNSNKIYIRQNIKTFDDLKNILNTINGIESIKKINSTYPPANRKGRGEFLCHMLFNTENACLGIEPDVLLSNGVNLSVKSSFSGDARTGENMDLNVRDLLNQIISIAMPDLSNRDISFLTVDTLNNAKAKIKESISNIGIDKIENTFKEVNNKNYNHINVNNFTSLYNSLKLEIITEHDASGIIHHDRSDNLNLIKKADVDTANITLSALKNNRWSFDFGNKPAKSFEKAFLDLIKEMDSELNVLRESIGNSISGQSDAYVPKGKVLKEVYSYLFDLKKAINEGALAGRMIYPYEALDMTTEKLVSRIKQYGVPQKIIEKVDGQNLFFTVEKDGTLLFARNKEDMTHDDLVEKFTSHPAEKPFIEGGNAIKSGVESLLNSVSQEEVIRLFHPSEDLRTFVNFEIMHPEKPNQIIYDEKYIVFHGIVDYKNGREEVSRSNQDQRIQELVSLMSRGVSSAGFTLASNREVDLNQLTDVQIAEYTQRVYDISEELGMEEGETLGDGIMNVIGDEIEAEGVSLSDEALTIFTDFIIRGEDSEGRSIASREWTKLLSKEDVTKLRKLGLTSTEKVKSKISKILQPFKALFVEIGIILLKDVQSRYMSKETAKKNIEINKDKLSTALFDLENYLSSTPEEEWPNSIKSLIKHKEEVNRLGIENIVSTSVEGGVYNIDDSLEKVTGGFGPMNQIIGAAYRDNEGIFTTFKEKFMQQENNRRSLRDIFSLIF